MNTQALAANNAPRRRGWRRLDLAFVATVVLPTLVAAAYYGLWASDVYVSESRFVVRSPQRQTSAGLGALLQAPGLGRAQDDTYAVHAFVRGRDSLRELDQQLQLRAAYSNASIDRLNRFPWLDGDDSFEALHRHVQKHLQIDYDTSASITVLSVRAYSAAQAQALNEKLLLQGERLLMQLNGRSRRDLVELARKEVLQAEETAKQAALALSGYRADRKLFDPERQGALQLQAVAKLREELLATEAQLAQLRQLSPANPQIAVLAARVDFLRTAVANEAARVAGGGASLTALAPAYDRLVLDRTFADRQLASAMAALEGARAEAARQHLYLERLVQPGLPDRALEPRRVRAVLTVLLFGLLLWGVIKLLVGSIKEHAE